jgi:hypothetical protein
LAPTLFPSPAGPLCVLNQTLSEWHLQAQQLRDSNLILDLVLLAVDVLSDLEQWSKAPGLMKGCGEGDVRNSAAHFHEMLLDWVREVVDDLSGSGTHNIKCGLLLEYLCVVLFGHHQLHVVFAFCARHSEMEKVAMTLRDLMVLMQNAFPSCTNTKGKKCKFPFEYQNDLYDSCTNASNTNIDIKDEEVWCFVAFDQESNAFVCPQFPDS